MTQTAALGFFGLGLHGLQDFHLPAGPLIVSTSLVA